MMRGMYMTICQPTTNHIAGIKPHSFVYMAICGMACDKLLTNHNTANRLIKLQVIKMENRGYSYTKIQMVKPFNFMVYR